MKTQNLGGGTVKAVLRGECTASDAYIGRERSTA